MVDVAGTANVLVGGNVMGTNLCVIIVFLSFAFCVILSYLLSDFDGMILAFCSLVSPDNPPLLDVTVANQRTCSMAGRFWSTKGGSDRGTREERHDRNWDRGPRDREHGPPWRRRPTRDPGRCGLAPAGAEAAGGAAAADERERPRDERVSGPATRG